MSLMLLSRSLATGHMQLNLVTEFPHNGLDLPPAGHSREDVIAHGLNVGAVLAIIVMSVGDDARRHAKRIYGFCCCYRRCFDLVRDRADRHI